MFLLKIAKKFGKYLTKSKKISMKFRKLRTNYQNLITVIDFCPIFRKEYAQKCIKMSKIVVAENSGGFSYPVAEKWRIFADFKEKMADFILKKLATLTLRTTVVIFNIYIHRVTKQHPF